MEKDFLTDFINRVIEPGTLMSVQTENVQLIKPSGMNNRMMKPICVASLVCYILVTISFSHEGEISFFYPGPNGA